MASCELCGKEKVSTRKARTAGIQVEACARCIESMNLQVVELPTKFTKMASKKKHAVTSRGDGGKDIMAKKEKELGVKSILLGFGLDSDAIHSPNEHYGIFNYLKGIETISYFFENYIKLK